MKRWIIRKTSFSLVFFLLFNLILPAFGQNAEGLKFLEAKYRAAYLEYTNAVAQGKSYAEIQPKLDAYFEAYAAYKKACGPSAVPQPSGESGEKISSQANSASESSEGNSGVVVPEKETKNTVQSWFAKTFSSIKEKFFGKAGKEMPLFEKILWNIGKALIPTFGVMLTAAVLAPLSPVMMIVGGIVVGAGLGGLLTYAYEKRMNAKYRETPKEDAKIWRDVTVQATVEAIMAPFNLATGGLFGMVGPTVGSAIGKVALTQAALTFTGSALSANVGGLVKHLWAKHYFHIPEKIAAKEKEIDSILEKHLSDGTLLSEEEKKKVDQLHKEVQDLKGEDYTSEDVLKNLKRAAISATISGFAGSIVSDRFYTYETGRWADRISMKVFGSAAQGKAISSLVSTMPVNYLGGATNAMLEKSFVNQDIQSLRNEQKNYPPGTAAHEYYEGLIHELEVKRDSIKLSQAGLDSMLNNFAVRAAQLSVQALKYNLYDAPKEKQRVLDERYRQNDPEWKKANELYEKYQTRCKQIPDPRKFKSPIAYAKAQASYLKSVESSRRDWLKQCLVAKEAENRPDRQLIKQEIKAQYEKEVKLNQMLELGRLSG